MRRSTDGGATWATLGGGLPASLGRVALARGAERCEHAVRGVREWRPALTGIFRTTDGGTNWTVTAATPAGVGQTGYNLVLGVHPTDADTVMFGEVHLWRTTNAGGAWTRVSIGAPGIHADQHAVAFHPTNGNLVFVGNDGGVFRSNDGGVTYAHRNKDLATLQYFICANHSLWDAVMLGGTQDNGAQRYLGHPAWEHSALGDGAYAAINATTNTRRWFESRWWGFPLFRNDSAGAAGAATLGRQEGDHRHEQQLVLSALRDGSERLASAVRGLRPPVAHGEQRRHLDGHHRRPGRDRDEHHRDRRRAFRQPTPSTSACRTAACSA